MAVTAPVSLTKIKTEFSGPDNQGAYVRGGTYVPNTPANSAISTTVAGLAISQFLNASNVPAVSLPDWNSGGGFDNNLSTTVSYNGGTGEGLTVAATVELIMNTNGTMAWNGYLGEAGCGGLISLVGGDTHTWLNSGSAGSYYVRLDKTTGDDTSGSAQGTNLVLSSQRVWTVCAQAGFGDANSTDFQGTISIRDAGDNVLASKSIRLFVDASNSD